MKRHQRVTLLGLVALFFVSCSDRQVQIYEARKDEYYVLLTEEIKGFSLAEVALSLRKSGKTLLDAEVIYGNDSAGDFRRHFPQEEWLTSKTLRFFGPRLSDSRILVANKGKSSAILVRVEVGESLILMLDLEPDETRDVGFVGGNASGWVRYTVVYPDSSGAKGHRTALQRGEGLVYTLIVNGEGVVVEDGT